MQQENRPPGTAMGRMILSSEAVYGLVLVAGMIVVSRSLTARSLDALLTVIATLLVFFAAHVYAGTVAHLIARDGRSRTLRDGFVDALRHSSGMLVVGVVPIVILTLGVSGLLRDDDAVWLALLADVLLLGALGWLIAATRVHGFWARAGGALITAAFGGVLIALKALVHH